jgi:hypothetical protein
MSDKQCSGVLLAVLILIFGVFIGWQAARACDHSEAVAAGHAEFRYNKPADGTYGLTEFCWLPACRKDRP